MSSDDTNGLEAFGIWHVTTEGDCEGRTTTDLGVHEGYLDQVAFDLAGEAMYTLEFNPPGPKDFMSKIPSLVSQVRVSLGHRFKLYSMAALGRTAFFAELLKDRPVQVQQSSYYNAVELHRTISPETRARARELELRFKREAALAKLTPEERAILGVRQIEV